MTGTSRRGAGLRIVLAPNAFKGTFDAVEVARAWRAIAPEGPELDLRPMSVGGDGFVAVVRFYRPDTMSVRVLAPAEFDAWLEEKAEAAAANLGAGEAR